ncbi:MAG: hypothetical protein GY841_16070 [FCB group bacterium]|nr:hypothetical protein [FCB group bacterium]
MTNWYEAFENLSEGYEKRAAWYDEFERLRDEQLPEPEDTEPGYAEVIGKGVVRGAEGLASGVGSAARWAGEVVGSETLAEAGDVASDYWDKAAQEGMFAGDEELFAGTFMENPSFKRAVGIVAEAAPSLAASLVAGGVGAAALGVRAGAAVGAGALGLLEGAPQYEEAREEGKSIGEASTYGALSTVATAALEYLPISYFLKGGKSGIGLGALIGGAGEGVTEASQTVAQNMIAKYGYDNTRELTEGIIESIIGGAGMGGMAGAGRGALNNAEKRQRELVAKKLREVKERAERNGLDPVETDRFVDEISRQMAENKDKIAAVMESVLGADRGERAAPERTITPTPVGAARENIRKRHAQKEIDREVSDVEATPPGGPIPAVDAAVEKEIALRKELDRERRDESVSRKGKALLAEQEDEQGRRDIVEEIDRDIAQEREQVEKETTARQKRGEEAQGKVDEAKRKKRVDLDAKAYAAENQADWNEVARKHGLFDKTQRAEDIKVTDPGWKKVRKEWGLDEGDVSQDAEILAAIKRDTALAKTKEPTTPQQKQFTFDESYPETFEYGGRQFDIQKAKKILNAAPRDVEQQDISKLPPPGKVGITVLKKGREKADTSIPVIRGTYGGESFIIDGHHRLAKAQKEGLTELPSVTLTEAETREVLGEKPPRSAQKRTAEPTPTPTITPEVKGSETAPGYTKEQLSGVTVELDEMDSSQVKGPDGKVYPRTGPETTDAHTALETLEKKKAALEKIMNCVTG